MNARFTEPSGFGFRVDAHLAPVFRETLGRWSRIARVEEITRTDDRVTMLAIPADQDPMTLISLHRSLIALDSNPRLAFETLNQGQLMRARRACPL